MTTIGSEKIKKKDKGKNNGKFKGKKFFKAYGLHT